MIKKKKKSEKCLQVKNKQQISLYYTSQPSASEMNENANCQLSPGIINRKKKKKQEQLHFNHFNNLGGDYYVPFQVHKT